MPIRTGSVVAMGMILLAVVGVSTIFGNNIAAVISPPPIDPTKTEDRTTPANPLAAPPPGSEPRPKSPVTRDAGSVSTDGKS